MDTIKKEDIPPMLNIIAYNQYQAYSFGLNHTQAIIMNYMTWCPQWANQYTIDGDKYYLVHLSKGLKDMPTLDIKKDTLRTNINELIKKGLLKRELVDSTKPVYKVADEWMTSSPASADRPIKVRDIQKAIKDGMLSPSELVELNKLFSSYTGKDIVPMKFTFSSSLSGGLALLLKDRLPKLKLDLKRRTMTDDDLLELKDYIVEISLDVGLIKKEADDTFTTQSIEKVIGVIREWFNYHGAKGTVVKNPKSSLNTWINNSVKFSK